MLRLRKSPLWWILVPATITLAVVIGIFVSRWDAIGASHWAYCVALVIVGAIAALAIGFSVLTAETRPQRPRSSLRTWVMRVVGITATVGALSCLLWLRPLPASSVAVAAMTSGEGVTVSDSATQITLRPDSGARSTGLIFFPGALVDPRAYVPILRQVADAGYLVVIIKAPLNIAFTASRAAGAIIAANQSITRWVIGGHSLGGVVAARYASNEANHLDGLLLWASYPCTDSSDATWLRVMSISASNDGLATPAKIEAARHLLPPSTVYVEIHGAIHADFGDYGPQKGDGTPTITHSDAQSQIVRATLLLMDDVSVATPTWTTVPR